jgi:serine phosphatase RsbU (regulator of sigma subunit)
MSMLGMALMSEIVNKFDNIEPDELLNQLRKYIIRTLQQKGEPGESKDGMDMVVCRFHKNRKKLSFSCANIPVYLIRDNELLEFKGDKMPVAIHEVMIPFKSYEIDILPGDTIYLFSDGFADQFGGQKNKKFLYSRFKNLLLEAQSKDLKSQGILLDTTIDQWKGSVEQIDDIMVIGIRF